MTSSGKRRCANTGCGILTLIQIVHTTGALFLVDDSGENALDASTAIPPVRVLLFGKYPWNAVIPRPAHQDSMTYIEKERRGLLQDSEDMRATLVREGWLPDGVERVAEWEDVVRWVEHNERHIR